MTQENKTPKIHVYTKEFRLVSCTGDVFQIERSYLERFKYFQEIFQAEPELKEIQLSESCEVLEDMVDFLYKKRDGGDDIIKNVSFLYHKWDLDPVIGSFNTMRIESMKDLEKISSRSEKYFRNEISALLLKCCAGAAYDNNNYFLSKDVFENVRLTDTMKAFLFELFTTSEEYRIARKRRHLI